MSSMTFECVRFCVYSNDHSPRHVHALIGSTRVVIDLLATGDVRIAERRGAVSPPNAKRSDVRKMLELAAVHFEELEELWEGIHGGA